MVFNAIGLCCYYFIFLYSVAPNITERPDSLTVLQGDIAEFSCQAKGRPPPNIVWVRRFSDQVQIEITEPDDVTIDTTQSGARQTRSTLTFNSAQPRDTAEYLCNATNEAGTEIQLATLTVHGNNYSYLIIIVYVHSFYSLQFCPVLYP